MVCRLIFVVPVGHISDSFSCVTLANDCTPLSEWKAIRLIRGNMTTLLQKTKAFPSYVCVWTIFSDPYSFWLFFSFISLEIVRPNLQRKRTVITTHFEAVSYSMWSVHLHNSCSAWSSDVCLLLSGLCVLECSMFGLSRIIKCVCTMLRVLK